VRYVPPQGTYLAWLDCRALDLGDDTMAEPGSTTTVTGPAAAFLARGRVALSTGAAFGTGGSGHVRLNFATSPDVLAEAVRRMASAVPVR
jgi:cystathionine beta-lyase